MFVDRSNMQENFEKNSIPFQKCWIHMIVTKFQCLTDLIAIISKYLIDLIVRTFGFDCLIWLQDLIIDEWITKVTTK